jgi:hypothetical protein
MLVVKAEFAVDVIFLIFECDGRSLLSYVVKIWKKRATACYNTLWLINPKYRIFRQTRVRFTQKGKIGRLHLFFALKNRFLKKQEKRR